MDENRKKNDVFGTAPIGKLLVKYSIPGIVSLLVNSIYNLVDQIFIGQGVGYLANAATNAAHPFTVLILAFSLLVAMGTAANVSLSLGRKQQDIAEKCAGTGFLLSIVVGVALTIIGEVFLVPLLKIFGATENVMPYAITYSRITFLGAPLMTMGIFLNNIHRADGAPRHAMISMALGAITNIILDALFVLVLPWGVAGAAIATVIGQAVTLAVGLHRIPNMKLVNIRLSYMKLDMSISGKIASIGISSFLTQSAVMLSNITMNNVAVTYGAMSKFGSDIPLTCFGIIGKLVHIMMSFVMGIGMAAQPIFGYNYGAEKYDRVKKLLYFAMAATTVVGIVGMVVFQSMPQQIINLFGQESALYNEFAVTALKSMTLTIALIGIPANSSTLYQAIGKPMRAIVMSLSRQIIFVIPCMIILPRFFGIYGLMYSYPVADVLSFILAIILLVLEVRNINGLMKAKDRLSDTGAV